MTHYVLCVGLRDDAAVGAIQAHHRRVWPEVLERAARRHQAMEIHILGAARDGADADGRDVRRVSPPTISRLVRRSSSGKR
jgi:hypothetical protein